MSEILINQKLVLSDYFAAKVNIWKKGMCKIRFDTG